MPFCKMINWEIILLIRKVPAKKLAQLHKYKAKQMQIVTHLKKYKDNIPKYLTKHNKKIVHRMAQACR